MLMFRRTISIPWTVDSLLQLKSDRLDHRLPSGALFLDETLRRLWVRVAMRLETRRDQLLPELVVGHCHPRGFCDLLDDCLRRSRRSEKAKEILRDHARQTRLDCGRN